MTKEAGRVILRRASFVKTEVYHHSHDQMDEIAQLRPKVEMEVIPSQDLVSFPMYQTR